MNLPTAAAIQNIFSQAPASFRFLTSNGRITAAASGAAMQIAGPPEAPTSVALAVVLPPKNERMARRGGILLTLLLVQVAPDWDGATHWLTGMLQAAARDPALQTASQTTRDGLRFLLTTDREKSMATLTVLADEG